MVTVELSLALYNLQYYILKHTETFHTFLPDTVEGITKLIKQCPSKSCSQDQLPAGLFNEHMDIVVERVVTKQIQDYLTHFNLHEPFQSVYRKNPSTETALVRVQNDILTALDNNEAPVLVLLDPSAAFDTVDHNMLLGRLSEFCISGTVWNWFKSYLSPKSQRVQVRNACTYATFLRFGIPQGSVLGLVLFTLLPPLCG